MRKIICFGVILICAAFVTAQKKSVQSKPIFTSVYTDMKRDCKTPEDKAAEAQGTDPITVCRGYGGYRISISYSAWAAGLAIEDAKSPDVSISLGMDYGGYGTKGEKIEWRLANGKPFAVIVRLGKYKERGDEENPFADENRTGSKLLIKGLKNFEQIDFEVDGTEANANQKAREIADNNFNKK